MRRRGLGVGLLVGALVLVGAALVVVRGDHARSALTSAEADVEAAWAEVSQSPRSPQVWAKLGDAQAHVDQTSAAEHAYRTAIRLGARDPTVPARLGFLLYRAGTDDEALVYLKRARDRGAALPMLDWTIAQLETLPVLAPTAAVDRPPVESAPARFESQVGGRGEGGVERDGRDQEELKEGDPEEGDPEEGDPEEGDTAEGELEEDDRYRATRGDGFDGELVCALDAHPSRARGVLRIPVQIGDGEYWLVVDTGASITVLNRALIEDQGIPVEEEGALRAITPTGLASFDRAVVPSLEVAGRAVEELMVAVCDGCTGDDADGLLGLDVQAALRMELRVQRRQVVFVECEE